MMEAGRFISVEGGEGVGKTTQIAAIAKYIKSLGHDVIVTREPGGTDGAEAIRSLLLDGNAARWGARAEALLFAAARSDHVERLIRPALHAGKWVISDRYLDSSRAYQGGASAIGDEQILALHEFGSMGMLPDRTLILELPGEMATIRANLRDNGQQDRIGGRSSAFHKQVAASFRQFAEKEPRRIRIIDASGDVETVTARIMSQMEDLFG